MSVHVPSIPLPLVLVPTARPASRPGRALATPRHSPPASGSAAAPGAAA